MFFKIELSHPILGIWNPKNHYYNACAAFDPPPPFLTDDIRPKLRMVMAIMLLQVQSLKYFSIRSSHTTTTLVVNIWHKHLILASPWAQIHVFANGDVLPHHLSDKII